MSFARYPTYKDSGVEWLGEVPGHWGVSPVKNLATIVNGYPFDSAQFDPAEGAPLIRIRDLNKSDSDTFFKGQFVEAAAVTADDVLIGMDGDFNVGRWRGVGRALLNQRMCCVRGNTMLLTRLLEYCLPARLKAINDLTYATTVKHLSSSQVERSLVAVPPEDEQHYILAFLDRETAKIDALVAEQQRLIELLKEKRQAVISHAVTKGLNPDVPMKDSGIEWLGEVPAHWDVTRVKALCKVISKGTTPTTVGAEFTADGVRFLKAENITETGISAIPEFFVSEDTHDTLSRSSLVQGDVLVVIAGATAGKSAVLMSQFVPANTNQAVSFLRPRDPRQSDWINLWLSTSAVRNLIVLTSVQSAQPNLSMEDLGNIPLTVPPVDELQELLARVHRDAASLDGLTTEAQRAIDLLQERRTALISAAVTGQIDVRPASEGASA